jgi:predicted ATPase/DNA-binding SARP family transcriptional activator
MSTPERAGSSLVIRLFGPFDVRLSGVPLPRLRTRKGEWLLALLTLRQGRDVERAWLAGTLWPESPAARALTSLRRSLNDLRAALGPEAHRLQSPTHRALRLELAGAEVDVTAFDAAIALGHEKALEQAVQLYHGPLLEGCVEEWALLEREVRAQAYLDALERLAGWASERGEHGAAVARLRLVVADDPLRESAARALMHALAAGGNDGAAIEVFRVLRLRLHDGLNLQPAPETNALFHQLRAEARQCVAKAGRPHSLPPRGQRAPGALPEMRDARGAAPRCDRFLQPHTAAFSLPGASVISGCPAAGGIPHPLTELIGREKELREIEARVATARLVTLIGTGGVGKTRLAIQVTEELADDFADGARFVDLAALSDPAFIPQSVARVLDAPEQPGRPLIETLLSVLRPTQLLLVLDNCEHMVQACAELAATLLQGCPHLRILATSRQALGVTGETAWRVPSLPVPVESLELRVERPAKADTSELSTLDSQLSTLMSYAAVRLLVERAIASAPGFTLTERNAPAVVQVCRRLDGIPLAIELAAARLKALSADELAARLDDRFRLLNEGSRTALPRQQTLRATIDWSYELLSEPERALLRRLSVFAGGWTLEAAVAVCGEAVVSYQPSAVSGAAISHQPSAVSEGAPALTDGRQPTAGGPDDVLDLLTALVDKSLVIYEAGGAEGAYPRSAGSRYRLLETVRQYARERLMETEEADRVRTRHQDWFLALAEQAEPELLRSDQLAWLDRLEAEHDNLRAAMAWCLEAVASGQWSVASDPWSMVGPAEPESASSVPLSELTTDHHPLTTAVEAEPALRMAGALWAFWSMRGYWTEGLERLVQLLALPQASPRTAARARALHCAGILACCPGDLGLARAFHEESLAIQQERGDNGGIAASLHGLGHVAFLTGDYEAAREPHAASLAIRRELGDRAGIAASLAHVACLALVRDDYPAARSLFEESLVIYKELGDGAGTAGVLNGLGHVARRQGEYAAARSLTEEGLALRRARGDRDGVAQSLVELGDVVLDQGDSVAAREYYEEALAIRRELGSRAGVADALGWLGEAARQQGDYAQARRLREESLALWRAVGSRIAVIHSLGALGHLAREQGEYAEAHRLYAESLRLRQELGDPITLAQSLEDFAELAAAQRQWTRMTRLLGAARALRDAADRPLLPGERASYDEFLAAARGALTEEALAAAWVEGQAMTLEEAVSLALEEGETATLDPRDSSASIPLSNGIIESGGGTDGRTRAHHPRR